MTANLTPLHVCYWHKADMLNALANVRFWGQSGRDRDIAGCLFMTQIRRGPGSLRLVVHGTEFGSSRLCYVRAGASRSTLAVRL
jgi:hypothetical protein